MGIRTRRARKHARTHIVGFGLVGFVGFGVLLALALCVSLWTLVDSWLQDLPDYKSADAYLVAEPTEVYAADNTKIADFYIQNRKSVALDQISEYVIKGTVDTEDIRFYDHNGVDLQGILRAVAVQIKGGSEGASTITQQLVRNTVLKDEQFDKTLKRKVREAYIAIQMEKEYTKDQILNMYLNTIYYGHGAYGIEAASITYFNKDAKDLTLAEAATLIGVPNSPTMYDPIQNPEASRSRRDVVLNRMLTAGDITQQEYDEAKAQDIVINQGQNVTESSRYPFFTDYVKQLLSDDFDSKTINQGGLKVYTTLDPTKQKAAEDSVNETLDSIGQKDLESALVAVNNKTGYIEAMVGGRDYKTSQFNLATQAARQPGSSFKAFTLVTAISQGMNPTVRINANSPLKISPTWTLQNDSNYSWGTISLARATEISSNTAYAQVSEVIGAANIASMAKQMGVKVDLPAYESLTLGVIGIPPLQMAEAYTTIASGGLHRDSVAITKIEDRNGNTVYEHKDEPKQIFSAGVALATDKVLEGVVNNGTATTVKRYAYGVNQPIAGKTGTTSGVRDLWFVGYTPQTTVAVWTGYREEKAVYVGGAPGHPYNTSCPVFGRYLQKTLAGAAREEFPEGETPTYKDNSSWKFMATAATANQYSRQQNSQTNTQTTTTTDNTNATETDTQKRQTENTSNQGGTGNETTSGNNQTGQGDNKPNSGESSDSGGTSTGGNSSGQGGNTGNGGTGSDTAGQGGDAAAG